MSKFLKLNRLELLKLNERADDNNETKQLISEFEVIKKERIPLFLNKDDFNSVLKWKLRNQFDRQKKIRKLNTNEIIKKLTKLTFEIEHPNKKFEIELKISILTCLKGVGIPVASAILTLLYPNKYAVIDFRVWNQLFGENKTSFSLKNYITYLEIVENFSKKYNLSMQQIDIALWQYDIEN